jgi:hypothetical protein
MNTADKLRVGRFVVTVIILLVLGASQLAWATGSPAPVPPAFDLPAPDAPGVVIAANKNVRYYELDSLGYHVEWTVSEAVAAAADGDTIYVMSGEYYENVELYDRHGLTFIGEERAIIIADNDLEVFFLNDCSDITITNIDVVHTLGESECSHNCFACWDSTGILIEYCDISGCGYVGVVAWATEVGTEVRVDNCYIHDCEIAYDDYGLGLLDVGESNVIEDCTMVTYSYGDESWELDAGEAATPAMPTEPPAVLPVALPFELPVPWTTGMSVVCNDADRGRSLDADGYNVFTSIQDAIDAQPSPAGEIYVLAGTYFENIYIVEQYGLSLIGEEGVQVIADNDEDVCFVQDSAVIYIHNIDMVHEIGESPCLHNCIVIWDCADVLVDYCDLSGCGFIGVEVLGNGEPQNVMVEYCTIHNCEVGFYDVNGWGLEERGNVLWACTEERWEPLGY